MTEETQSFQILPEESEQEITINNREGAVRNRYQEEIKNQPITQPFSCGVCSLSDTKIDIIMGCNFLILFIILFTIYYLIYHFKKSEHKIRKSIIDSILTIIVIVISFIGFSYLTFYYALHN